MSAIKPVHSKFKKCPLTSHFRVKDVDVVSSTVGAHGADGAADDVIPRMKGLKPLGPASLCA
jgi:hypothetical protein